MTIAEDLNEAMGPWQTPDLTIFNNAIGSMFEEVEALAFDTDDGDGWSILLDPVRCPPKWLPWLAQSVGVRLPLGASEAQSRALISNPPNWRIGQPEAIKDAVKFYLTGTKTVTLTERDPVANPADPAYGLTVTVSHTEAGVPAGTYTRTSQDAKGIWRVIVATSNPNTIRLVVT